MLHGRTVVLLASAAVLAASAAALRGGDEASDAIRDDFESPRPVWRQEQTDATVNLLSQERSPLAAHDGRLSERFLFRAGPGSAFYYSYALPKVPVTEELRASLYVRSRRAGVRIFGRVILPADTDPDTGQPSFVLVPGTIYENVDRWQRLELVGMRPSIERQARVLRASTRRPVSLEGAYLDGLVVNLFGGEGESEVFLDELTVAPVAPALVAAHAVPRSDAPAAPKAEGGATDARPSAAGSAPVRLDRNRLRRNGYDWFATIIHAPGADVAALRSAGFDVLAEDVHADADRIRDAIRRGFLLMPALAGPPGGPAPEPAEVIEAAASYPERDSVAFWDLGERLGHAPDLRVRQDELERVRAIVSGLRRLPQGFSHLTTATIEGELPKYARAPQNLDILGIRPSMWGSAQRPLDCYHYLTQRRALTIRGNAGGLFCAWIDAAPPPVVQTAIWGQDVPPAWGALRVQPEQLRLDTYLALSAGYRAIGYRADADLTRTAAGRVLLIEMALLNEEIDLFQSILAQGSDPIPFYMTYPSDPPALPPPGSMLVNARPPITKEQGPLPGIRVAAIDTLDRRGSLLLVGDYIPDAQFQPPQSAMNDLKVTVPARESAQAFEISPGGVRPLDHERVPGGTRINLPEFGQTALILVTTDLALKERIEREAARVRPMAVSLAIEQAELQYQLVSEINGRLIADGHRLFDENDPKTPPLQPGTSPPNDEADLLAKAIESIKSARAAQEREDYQLAWDEARRASRPLRILMSAQWKKAVDAMVKVSAPPEDDRPPKLTRANANRITELSRKKKKPGLLVLPVASPPCVAYNTLPQHYLWVDWMRQMSFSPNLVPSGSFDDDRSLKRAGWANQSYQADGIKSTISVVDNSPDGRKRALRVAVEPAENRSIDTLPPYLDFPVAAVRSAAVRVRTGQLFRISVWVHRPLPSPPGMGGVIVRDSIGGEPLQFRWHDPIVEFSKVVLYRRAPADGELTVILGLAGYGEANFDDFRVEVVEGAPAPTPADVAGRPRRPRPSPEPESAPAPATAGRPVLVPRTSR